MKGWISVEAAIGGGKTTFLEHVVPHLNTSSYKEIPEPVEEWEESGVLKRSYNEPEFKFAAQCVFFTSRINNFRKLYDSSVDLHISERSAFSDKIFWKINCVDPVLNKCYMDMWKMWQYLTPVRNPDLFIYLSLSIDTCVKRTEERSREAESSMTKEYQQQILDEHNRIFMGNPNGVTMPDGTVVPCIVIDAEVNFRDDPEEAKRIAEIINKIF